MTSICVNCCKANQLKNLIITKGVLVDKCDICGSSNIKALDCEDNNLIQLFKALIRYNYSEWDYNTHWGGDGLEALFFKKNPILNWASHFDKEKLDDAILTFISNVYEEYDKGVTLFAGYGEHGEQNMFLKALARDFDSRLSHLSSQLEKKNYFLLENVGLDLLRSHVAELEAYVEEETEYFRARIGYAKEATPLFGWGEEWHYKPYGDNQIGASPPLKTNSGRLNRVGVSFLYLASDEKTAVAEVRPYPFTAHRN